MDPLRDKQTDSQPWLDTSDQRGEMWEVVALEGGGWRVISSFESEEKAREVLKEVRRQGAYKGFGIVGPTRL